MSNSPTLVFVHGSWHTAACYNKIITLLQEKHNLRCSAVTLPSMTGNPAATFKDDLDVTREAIIQETRNGHDVVVIAHSYGGMVGNSAIKGLARREDSKKSTFAAQTSADGEHTGRAQTSPHGHVIGLILIASGFTLTGLSFMDPFFGHPPPSWRVNKTTGYAELVTSPRELFYHDLPADEAEYWTSQLTTQSLKSLFEGGEFAYAGWMDVPVWYVGTVEDRGLPVVVQRLGVGMAREMGCSVEHRELPTSHSPFLSRPQETVEIVVEAVEAFTGTSLGAQPLVRVENNAIISPKARLWKPLTWYRFGLPLVFGHILGRCILIFGWTRRFVGLR